MSEPSIWDYLEEQARFDGPEYDHARDSPRLTAQISRVFNLMKDGAKRTLEQIATETGDPQASVSAQLRHLRKKRFGGHKVDKEHVGNGLYVYWLVVNKTPEPAS